MVADASAQRQRSQRFRVEMMRIEHIPVVSAIERRCFTQPWPQNAYRREIQSNRMAHYFVARVLESDDAVPPAEPRRTLTGGDNGLFGRLSRLLRGPLEPPPSPALEAELRSIVGYAGLWLMTDEAHITTIAVDPDFQGNGLGGGSSGPRSSRESRPNSPFSLPAAVLRTSLSGASSSSSKARATK